MFKSSFWYPDDWKQGILLLAVLLMIPLHQSELFGLMESTAIVLGWIPAQIAFDIAFNIIAIVILILMYYLAPKPSEKHRPEEVET